MLLLLQNKVKQNKQLVLGLWPTTYVFMKERIFRFTNLCVRSLALAARFLFVLFLGKFYDAGTVGVFGLLNTSVILAYMIMGFDFYSYANRELVKAPEEEKAYVLTNQAIFLIFTFVLSLPVVIYLVFYLEVLDDAYLLPFVLLLFNEYLGQEFYRIFTTLQKPLTANAVFFIRNASWVILYFFAWFMGYTSPEATGLEVLVWYWVAASIAGNLLSLFMQTKYVDWQTGRIRLDLSWIKKGFKVSLWFFASTIAYKIIEFSNRYIIDFYQGKDEVGYYTFFSQIANLVNVIVFTMVVMHMYPVLLAKSANQQLGELHSFYKVMIRKIVIWSLASGACVGVLIFPVLQYLGREAFFDHIHTFFFLVLANILLNTSLAPHYALYALHKDKMLFTSTLFGVLVNIVLNFVLIPWYGAPGAAIAMLCSYVLVLIFKLDFWRKSLADVSR